MGRNSHGQRNCSPWGQEELDTTEQLSTQARTHTHTHTHTSSLLNVRYTHTQRIMVYLSVFLAVGLSSILSGYTYIFAKSLWARCWQYLPPKWPPMIFTSWQKGVVSFQTESGMVCVTHRILYEGWCTPLRLGHKMHGKFHLGLLGRFLWRKSGSKPCGLSSSS